MREIEVKIKADNLEEIERKVLDLGCKLSAPIYQRDVIYSRAGSTSEWENAREGHVVLRIRWQNDVAIFNLKQQRSNESDNLEYETKIEDAEAIHQILSVLGYAPQVEVKKIRREGKFGEYEICLDEVEKLGTYVELEKLTSDDADPTEVQEELFRVLESLGLFKKNHEVRGYDTQIWQLEHKNRY